MRRLKSIYLRGQLCSFMIQRCYLLENRNTRSPCVGQDPQAWEGPTELLTSLPAPSSAPRMGTPASVVSEPPPWRAPPEVRGRKQAAANIFQDAELLQIQGLFQRSGDQLAEERAQIVWECAGDHRVAEALKRLRRKRPPRQKPLGPSVHHCSRLRTAEPCAPQSSATETASSEQHVNSRRASARIRRNWRKPGPTSYLHQIRH
ncbi:PREDICTED: arginine vasopressin-induced protein 1 isoform X2 [Bison bison bison]|uniref:Arginine vasopressin-induced protein 1 n=1 Tax=Bison bison bison TaxID=43346 RepID=A0A6P3GWW5_BISBB|nr:PREDICTED: arginine vasopressin-induced protein 1 isoform X2 [Bison bison bison]